ncbi:MAG: carboxypeptidase regulatory-like domain-containing protein, partial [Parafilimonas sp.]|nr:carboxypeptidase regulatory-like domain-containing protein [Parafilimonas sp.]
MKKLLPLLSAFVFLAFTSKAQNITGVVKDAEGKFLTNASVSLLNAKDSSLVKLAVTNTSGEYHFQNIKDGRYLARANYVGYTLSYSPVFEVSGSGDVNVAAISLNKNSSTLKEVTVTAQKPI